MKKLLYLTALIIPQFLFSDYEMLHSLSPPQQSTYGYFMLSDTVIVPGMGLGIRHHQAHLGIDVSLNAPFVPIQGLLLSDLKVMGLIYPTRKGFYLGAGLGISPMAPLMGWSPSGSSYDNLTLAVSLTRLAIGYEWEDDKREFIQLSILVPPVLAYGRSF